MITRHNIVAVGMMVLIELRKNKQNKKMSYVMDI